MSEPDATFFRKIIAFSQAFSQKLLNDLPFYPNFSFTSAFLLHNSVTTYAERKFPKIDGFQSLVYSVDVRL